MFFKKFEYHDNLKLLEHKFNPYRISDKKICSKCSYCCWDRPGSLSKKDFSRIAKYLNISEHKFLHQFLVIDKIKSKFYLLPRRKEQRDLAGKYVPCDRTYDIRTPCVFLNQKTKLCKIYKVRPQGCRDKCWIKSMPEGIKWAKKDLKALGWDGKEIEEENNFDNGMFEND